MTNRNRARFNVNPHPASQQGQTRLGYEQAIMFIPKNLRKSFIHRSAAGPKLLPNVAFIWRSIADYVESKTNHDQAQLKRILRLAPNVNRARLNKSQKQKLAFQLREMAAQVEFAYEFCQPVTVETASVHRFN